MIGTALKEKRPSQPDHEYMQTLGYFLEHSNADEVDVKWFMTAFPLYCPKLMRKIRTGNSIGWLEVGPGPGSKSLEIAKRLATEYQARIRLVAVEPSSAWIGV